MQDKPFLLYLFVSPHALTSFLVQYDDDGKQRVVYYIICILVDYEIHYSAMEKQCLAIVFATQKSRHYLLHVEPHVIVKSDLLKHLFTRIDLVGRLVKWVMLLSQFDIKFVTEKLIKGQVDVDQLEKSPSSHSFPNLDLFSDEDLFETNHKVVWEMYFNGSRCQASFKVDVVLISPEGKPIPLSFLLEFHFTNNCYPFFTYGLIQVG